LDKRVFAIGDIHGCFNTFVELFSGLNPTGEDVIVLLGDYIDRGPKSKEVLDFIMGRIEKGLTIIPLMGNHENMLLESLTNARSFNLWMCNGGEATLKSFGVKSANEINARYLNFIRNMPLFYTFQNFIFVHAGFNESKPDVFSDKASMLWTRRECYNNPYFADKTIIHGHTPISKEELFSAIQSNFRVINIDTGCVFNKRGHYGNLSAIEIPSLQICSVSNSDMQ
jgi:serine/threonine protein phosphatase 1